MFLFEESFDFFFSSLSLPSIFSQLALLGVFITEYDERKLRAYAGGGRLLRVQNVISKDQNSLISYVCLADHFRSPHDIELMNVIRIKFKIP